MIESVVEEVFKGMARSAKTGDGDFAVAFTGPNKGGLFTAVAAVSCDGAADVEKALRALAKDVVVKVIAFDVATAEGVSIHRVMIPVKDEALAKVFGPTAALCVAFGPKAIYAGVGPDALEAVKAALASKAGPAPAASLTGNPSRLAKLVGAPNGTKGEKFFAALLGTDNKPATALTVTLTGGAELTLRVSMNVKQLPRLIASGGEDLGKP